MKNEYQGQNPAPTKIAFENALHNVDQSKKTEEEIAAERKREEQTVEYQYQQQLAKQPKELTHAEFLAKLKAEDPRYAKAPQVEGGKNVVETMEVKQADVTLTPVSSDVQG